jgi:hypothetical protein
MTAGLRARVLGAALLIAMFAAGWMAGIAWTRTHARGVNVDVRMTTGLPRELKQLGLSSAQEDTLRLILRDGQQRTLKVLHEFEPHMRALADSVELAIRAVLTPAQRAALDAAGKSRVRDQLEQKIDTVRK